jgi:SAM-dependent methyltransferase
VSDPTFGWDSSAAAWLKEMAPGGDATRRLLLDPHMLELCGDVADRDVLDIGCGEGRFCRMLAARGARAIGVEPTLPLLEAASDQDKKGVYVRGVAENLPITSGVVDLCVFYLVLIDIPDFRAAIEEAVRVLRPGGRIAVANLASYATTTPNGWARDELNQRTHFPIDYYLDERALKISWREMRIVNHHRPLSAYVQAFLSHGLLLKEFLEPAPTPELIAKDRSWEYHRRVPYVNAMLWELPH